jgi:hypothetical protein
LCRNETQAGRFFVEEYYLTLSADVTSINGAAHRQPRQRLGEILVGQGLLAEVSVQRLVDHANCKKIRLGMLLETIGLVTPEDLAEALAIQYRVILRSS